MKIIVFGIGKVGTTLLSYPLRTNCEIVAVVDNAKSRWGESIGRYTVQSPEVILSTSYDFILIAITREYFAVKEQLLRMGVAEEKIRTALDWYKAKFVVSGLDDFFVIAKQTIPFVKRPVTGITPSGCETSKAHARRVREGFFEKYCQGEGLDIGCASDPLTPECSGWDLPNGDAQYLDGVEDESFDFVYSSHCLEHMVDVRIALKNWFRVVREGGTLILYIPHRDLYEKKRTLPSRWNIDHKHMFLIGRAEAPDTLDIVEEIKVSLTGYDIEYVKKCDEGHTIDNPLVHSDGEYSIEIIIRKLKADCKVELH